MSGEASLLEGQMMKQAKYRKRTTRSLLVWIAAMLTALSLDHLLPAGYVLPSGISPLQLLGLFAGIVATADLCAICNQWLLARANRPPVEGLMVGRLYRLAAVFVIIGACAYGLGKLAAFGQFFTLFGGMLLGWSLQAPVSGFAAWVLVSLKRPFRPGDRVQFPSLGLTGDVADVGPMYTVLDQVGGTIGSEEAVGRFILVPNAMLFSQVVINYTVTQEAPYMLDEVLIRITYDSDWETAERILLDAAADVTKDIIEATGVQPYIRSDLYDYGVYLRLRYQTRVKDRPEIAYEITKRIFRDIQRTRSIDLAIPYIYSYRAGADRKEADLPRDKESQEVQQIPLDHIEAGESRADPQDVALVAQSIATQGLLQPIVVLRDPHREVYEIVAGQIRFEACKQLGWKHIPAVVRGSRPVATP